MLDATDPGINLFRFDVEKGTAVPVKSLSGIQDPCLSDSEPGWQVCLFGK